MICRSLFSLGLVLLASTALASPREMILYLDAAAVSYDLTARKGLAELVLPAAVRENSLRIRPLDGGSISRVTVAPARPPAKLQQEIAVLTEQKNRLQDRLKALETREAIFTTAAKSQSSKAPRKSKSNPDPLASVRQGTDFAIAQLEAVYTSRRKTEQELTRIATRLNSLTRQPGSGPTVRIAVTPATARVRISAILAAGAWQPRYDVQLSSNSETAQLTLRADLSGELSMHQQTAAISVVPARLTAQPHQLPPALQQPIQWQLPVSKPQFSTAPLNSFSFTLQNSSQTTLPSGQASVYRDGEYLGGPVFPELAPGTSATLSQPAN